jgi:catalase (peroxidase I)
VAYRDEGDAQLAGSDLGQVGVTDTRVASSKTTTALRAEMTIRSHQRGHPSALGPPPRSADLEGEALAWSRDCGVGGGGWAGDGAGY